MSSSPGRSAAASASRQRARSSGRSRVGTTTLSAGPPTKLTVQRDPRNAPYDAAVIAGPAGGVQWAVNGRFLCESFSGVQRVATGFLRALLADPGCVLLCPTGHRPSWWDGAVRDARVPPGRPGRLLWEQVAAPALARRNPVLNLANTAPLLC